MSELPNLTKIIITRGGIISTIDKKIEKYKNTFSNSLKLYPHTYHAIRGLIIYNKVSPVVSR